MEKVTFKQIKIGTVFHREYKGERSDFPYIKISSTEFKGLASGNVYDITREDIRIKNKKNWGLIMPVHAFSIKESKKIKERYSNMKNRGKKKRKLREAIMNTASKIIGKKKAEKQEKKIANMSDASKKALKLFDQGKSNKEIIAATGIPGAKVRSLLRRERSKEYAKRKKA